MVSQELPKMSLLAQYNDLCHYANVLTSGVENEFKIFVENQLNCVRKRKKTDEEIKQLHNKIANLEFKNERLETKIKHLKILCKDADSTIKKIKFQKECLESTIAVVKDIILTDSNLKTPTKEKLSFLSSNYKTRTNSPGHLQTIEEKITSLFSLSGAEHTDDDFENDARSSNRYSKRERSSSKDSTSVVQKKLEEIQFKVNREVYQQSTYEAISSSPNIPGVSEEYKSDSAHSKFSDYDPEFDADSLSEKNSFLKQSLKDIGKNHQFVSKTLLKSAKCLACRQNIGYLKRSLKCESCGITYHPECQNICTMLCFPIINTPTKGTAGTVEDYTSSSSPMIPPLVVHCVREIESRGMKEIGLYHVPSSVQNVRNLIEKFVSDRIIPCLNDADIHTLCIAIKEFLRSLNEPLITCKSWQAFVDAANLEDNAESSYVLLKIISDLPQPNRDTLSFLILHWQKIAESPSCKMDIEILSKVLGPIVVGFPAPETSKTNTFEERKLQYQVMKKLLSISSSFWQGIISVEI